MVPPLSMMGALDVIASELMGVVHMMQEDAQVEVRILKQSSSLCEERRLEKMHHLPLPGF